jgi:hypothetical protein
MHRCSDALPGATIVNQLDCQRTWDPVAIQLACWIYSTGAAGLLVAPVSAVMFRACHSRGTFPTSTRNGWFTGLGPAVIQRASTWAASWPGGCMMCPWWPYVGDYGALNAAARVQPRLVRVGLVRIRTRPDAQQMSGSSSRASDAPHSEHEDQMRNPITVLAVKELPSRPAVSWLTSATVRYRESESLGFNPSTPQ